MTNKKRAAVAEAEKQVAAARHILQGKAEAGKFNIGTTTVGALILAVEALVAALRSEESK